jgi:hypothetical protein
MTKPKDEEETVPSTQFIAVKDDDSTIQRDEAKEEDLDSTEPTEEDILLHPEPTIAIANPWLKSVLEDTPPTPRDSSPLQIAIDSIHPSKVADDGHLTSPIERKEEEVQLPTEVCEFPLVSKHSGEAEINEKGKIIR